MADLMKLQAEADKAAGILKQAMDRKLAAETEKLRKEREAATSLQRLRETLDALVARKIAAGNLDTRTFQNFIKYAQEPKRAFLEVAYGLVTHPVYGIQVNQGLWWSFKPYANLTELADELQKAAIGSWARVMEDKVQWLVTLLYTVERADPAISPANLRRSAVDAALRADAETLDRPDGLLVEHESLLAGLGVGAEFF